MKNKNLTHDEIEKLKEKLKGWFENPYQFNSWILLIILIYPKWILTASIKSD